MGLNGLDIPSSVKTRFLHSFCVTRLTLYNQVKQLARWNVVPVAFSAEADATGSTGRRFLWPNDTKKKLSLRIHCRGEHCCNKEELLIRGWNPYAFNQ